VEQAARGGASQTQQLNAEAAAAAATAAAAAATAAAAAATAAAAAAAEVAVEAGAEAGAEAEAEAGAEVGGGGVGDSDGESFWHAADKEDAKLDAELHEWIRRAAAATGAKIVFGVEDSDEESSVDAVVDNLFRSNSDDDVKLTSGGAPRPWVPPKVHPLLKELDPSVLQKVRFVCVFVCDHAVASYNWYCFILCRLRLMRKKTGAGEAQTLSPSWFVRSTGCSWPASRRFTA
jgi:hypothetical protein